MSTDAYLHPGKLTARLGIHPGQRVGDFGTGGAAAFGVPLGRAVGAEGEVFLFDVQKSSLSSALTVATANGLSNCKAVWSNLESYEGARGVGRDTLDAGVLVNVLHQTRKPKDVLAEIHRMLKPGGKLLVIDWNPEAKVSFAPEAKTRFPADHAEKLARGLGFAPVESFEAGPYHWGLVLAKT